MWHDIRFSVNIFVIIITCGRLIDTAEMSEHGEKSISNSQHDKHVLLKRYDQSYQTCLDNFEIRDDKIIRTQDSREMGAKYINEFELSSRDECLRACCGTETCDVFVFEEKNPGSCYLFHCGPSDDFKCKFTKHHNYTSAILQTNRHLNELETQIKLTKHEQELTRLRRPENTVESTGSPIATTVLIPGLPKETMPNMSPNTNASASNRRCSNYQFQCRASNECIAIYNACDGIPQCGDGSDEAPELGCPTQGTTSAPASPPRPTIAPQTVNSLPLIPDPSAPIRVPYSMNLQQQLLRQPPQQQLPHEQQPLAQEQQQPVLGSVLNVPPSGQPYQRQPFGQLPQDRWQHPPSSPGLPQQPLLYQAPHLALNALNSQPKMFPQVNNQVLPEKMYGREGEGPGSGNSYNNQWNNYQHGQPNQYPGSLLAGHPYEDGNSHIFNHKGNGLVADTDSPSSQYVDINRNEYNNNNNKYPGGNMNMYSTNAAYHQPMLPNNWLSNQQPQTHDLNVGGNAGEVPRTGNEHKPVLPPDYYYEDNHNQEGRLHLPESRPYPHQPSVQNNPASVDKQTMPDKLKHQAKAAFELSLETKMEDDLSSITQINKNSIDFHVKELPGRNYNLDATTAVTQVKHSMTSSVKKHKADSSPPLAAANELVAIESLDEEVSKPKGAILSLSLGMCICAILMVLVSCRVRMIRKRLRRGGKSPYTHDADYLVNGMYL